MWEALTAIGTIASAIVIAVTVVMAARQLRLTAGQLDHLRRATQLEAAMEIFREESSDEFWDGIRFVMTKLKERLEDDAFKSEVPLVGMADHHVHKELVILRAFDAIGSYVRHQLIEPEVIYASPVFVRAILAWEALGDVVAIHRHTLGPWIWENFEFLYADGRRWASERGRTLDLASMSARLRGRSGTEL